MSWIFLVRFIRLKLYFVFLCDFIFIFLSKLVLQEVMLTTNNYINVRHVNFLYFSCTYRLY